MNIFKAKKIHLTGIKGVAMTSLAQILLDMGKQVTGSDVPEDFVTKDILSKLDIKISPLPIDSIDHVSTNCQLQPTNYDLLIYTAAHGGPQNPQILQAIERGIPTLSQAEALAEIFNQKKGIAVCGVGGKSTVSAMIVWILHKLGKNPSFSVGVGNIPGIGKTGHWDKKSEYFVAEADEYVTDPGAKEVTPRFSFLKPWLTVCTNIEFDHPDVYQNFDQTVKVFNHFFSQIKPNGHLIANIESQGEIKSSDHFQLSFFGPTDKSNYHYEYDLINSKDGHTFGSLKINSQIYEIKLQIPGVYNVANAVAAVAACEKLGISVSESLEALKTFNSTQRRFEFKNEKNGVKFYDDYAHHPSEIKAAVQALIDWFPQKKKFIAFQPHTFSRTKILLNEFVEVFGELAEKVDGIFLLDIFASARESEDLEISSDLLTQKIKKLKPKSLVENVQNIKNLKAIFENLPPNSVALTLGAGDIYKVYKNF